MPEHGTAFDTPRADGNGVRAKTLRGLLVARELDTARLARSLTTRELAGQMTMSPAMLNRVMTGRRVPTALEIGGLCGLLDIDPARRPHLYRLTADADLTEWIIRPGAGTSALGAIEEVADTATWLDPLLIPRPLRTAAYHHALGHPIGDHQSPEPAAPPTDRFLLHPRALTHPAIPADVMGEQLLHLCHTAPNTIRLLPATFPPHPGFRVLHIDHFPPVVHIDHHGTHVILESPDSTAAHTTLLRAATTAAATAEHTRRTLTDLAARTGTVG
ncbi:hypothetical protein UO65_3007 [Actinokineospora spheciospongiae]|uniref:HTH cro/C1-type domain-containing protein n=1 Tax=Actinokineospora spheciospongiae TaxID=909613 RepID=W7J6F0_9PSEU|nr:Scr1 family TA system antitoxin-like transcriptional regulator [Actinokineospora spheciospongiae]EWC61649.1 hypothetical protein UO65_3007 [Actinokineospora spheciospongiae]